MKGGKLAATWRREKPKLELFAYFDAAPVANLTADRNVIRHGRAGDNSQFAHYSRRKNSGGQIVPNIDIDAIEPVIGVGYPPEFKEQSAGRIRRRLGDAGGLSDFGVNLTSLPPGKWSSQRHWHRNEDEFVFVVQGELVLVEDQGETILRTGDCAAFPKNSGNGHHLQNRSDEVATYLEIGSRDPDDLITCSDVDMMSSSRDGRFVHKDGSEFTAPDASAG